MNTQASARQEIQNSSNSANTQSTQTTSAQLQQHAPQTWGTAEFLTFGFARVQYPVNDTAA